jgi:hypothetical protein
MRVVQGERGGEEVAGWPTFERGTLFALGLTSILRDGFRMAGKNFIDCRR